MLCLTILFLPRMSLLFVVSVKDITHFSVCLSPRCMMNTLECWNIFILFLNSENLPAINNACNFILILLKKEKTCEL